MVFSKKEEAEKYVNTFSSENDFYKMEKQKKEAVKIAAEIWALKKAIIEGMA